MANKNEFKKTKFKRPYRVNFNLGEIPEYYVKKVILPQKIYIKKEWQWGDLQVEYYDCNDNKKLWEYILNDAAGDCEGIVTYYDGLGTLIDKFVFYLSPASVSLPGVDYSVSEVGIITLKFKVISVEKPKINKSKKKGKHK